MAKEGMRSMFGNLKSRISGFRHRDDEEYYDDEAYDDYEEDFEYEDDYRDAKSERDVEVESSYSNRRYDESERFAAEMDARYSQAVTTRPSRNYQSPRLVSIDDVRASTSAYESERGVDRYGEERFGGMTTVGTAASSVGGGAGGLDSLFSSTSASAWSTDSYGVSSSAMTQRFGSSRSLEIIRPLIYSEAEKIAVALKAGAAVVLALKGTPEALAARLTDFAFGVACALDATVERLAPKVYAITTAGDLTETERATLKSQGVI